MESYNQKSTVTVPDKIWSYIQDIVPKYGQCSSPTARLIHLRLWDLYNVWNYNELTEQYFIYYNYKDFTAENTSNNFFLKNLGSTCPPHANLHLMCKPCM